MKRHRWFWGTLILFFVACSTITEKTPVMQSPSPGRSPTVTFTAPVEATEVVIGTQALSGEPTLLANSTPKNLEPRNIECFSPETLDRTLPDEGVIVFNGRGYQTASFLYRLDTQQKTILPQAEGETLRDFVISPDHQWLAYRNWNPEGQSQLILVDADGKIKKGAPWDSDWRYLAGWLDHQRLLVSRMRGEQLSDSILIVNPFTGEQQELQPDFDKIWPVWIENNVNWDGFSKSGTIYTPDLGFVIYPYRDARQSGLVLWNIKTQQEVVSVAGGFGNYPKLDSANEGFLVDLSVRYSDNAQIGEELFRLDRSGKLTRLTYLNETGEVSSIGEFNESPDERRLLSGWSCSPLQMIIQISIRIHSRKEPAVWRSMTSQPSVL